MLTVFTETVLFLQLKKKDDTQKNSFFVEHIYYLWNTACIKPWRQSHESVIKMITDQMYF